MIIKRKLFLHLNTLFTSKKHKIKQAYKNSTCFLAKIIPMQNYANNKISGWIANFHIYSPSILKIFPNKISGNYLLRINQKTADFINNQSKTATNPFRYVPSG